MPWQEILRATVALLFLTSVSAKLARPRDVVEALRAYGTFPTTAVPALVALLVALETCIVVLLVGGWETAIAVAVAGVLLVVFALVVAVAQHRRGGLPCGCLGGVLEIRTDNPIVATNAAAACICLATAILSPAGSFADSRALGRVAPIWMAGAVLAATYWLVAYGRTVLAAVRGYTQGASA